MNDLEKAAMAYETVCLHARGKKYGAGDARDPSEKDLMGLAFHEGRERPGKSSIGISPNALRKQIKGTLGKAIIKLKESARAPRDNELLEIALHLTEEATCAEELGEAALLAAKCITGKQSQ